MELHSVAEQIMVFGVRLYFRVAFVALLLPLASGDCIDLDLGMESGSIPDSKITASSVQGANTPAKNGRLNFTSGSSWCAGTSDTNPYLQIDLQTLHIICAVSTQGNSQADQWVKNYTLKSSIDGSTWTNYKEIGQVKTLTGNKDRNSEVKHILNEGVLARYLRFLPETHHGGVCMRTEVFGVKQKPENLALGKPTSQSSTYSDSTVGNAVSGRAVDGNPNTEMYERSCSHTTKDNPSWWHVDLGPGHVPVIEIYIVNRFSSYSSIQDKNKDYKITLGSSSTVTNNPACEGLYSFIQFKASAVCFTNPLKTGRYVGIMTTKSQVLHLCEVEVYSRENLAYNKTTDQSSTDHGGVSSRGVNGNSDMDWNGGSCTHTNRENKAWWRVDLGQVEPVSEVYIVNRDSYGDRLSKFEIRVGTTSSGGGVTNPKCGGSHSIPEAKGLSFFCHPPLYGRYVTIRSLKLNLSLTVCEVEVYSERRACQIQPLGVASSEAFPDNSFSASSSSSGNDAYKGRLNGAGAWSPSTDTNASDYLQINLKYDFFICAVATQGKSTADHWTTKYKLLLSLNNFDWVTYQENSTDKVFNGNSGRYDIVKHNLMEISRARYIRFQPTTFSTHKALRVEVFGILKSAAPSQAPGSFVASPLSATCVKASWQLPPVGSRHGIITGFKLLYRRKSSAADSLTVLTIENNSTLTRDVTGLQKYTEYEFQVLAFSYAGDRPKSSVQAVRTDQDEPEAPSDFKATSSGSTQVTLEWKEPKVTTEEGLSYTVKYSGTKSYNKRFRDEGVKNAQKSTKYTVTNLVPDTNYTFELYGTSVCGKSLSRYMNVETIKEELPIIIEDISPSSVICEKQTLCSLSCHATSDAPLNYSWTKNGQVPVGDDIKIINNSIVLTPQDKKDYGVYVCHATNSFGSRGYKITLSEGLKSSLCSDMMKGDNNLNGTFNAMAIGFSCIVFVLLVVIGVIIWRVRVRLAVPYNRGTTTQEDITNGIGQPVSPRDQHASEPGSYMELHPRPGEGQSRAPPEYMSLQGANKDPEYYNVNKGNSEKRIGEIYSEIGSAQV